MRIGIGLLEVTVIGRDPHRRTSKLWMNQRWVCHDRETWLAIYYGNSTETEQAVQCCSGTERRVVEFGMVANDRDCNVKSAELGPRWVSSWPLPMKSKQDRQSFDSGEVTSSADWVDVCNVSVDNGRAHRLNRCLRRHERMMGSGT
jgi:hypothetical protein